MSIELKPCPFCGSGPIVRLLLPEIEGDSWTNIGCPNIKSCGIASVTSYNEREHFEQAAAKWNRRTPEQSE